MVIKDGISSEQKGEAYALLDSIQYFKFVFNLHLLKSILGIANELSVALQRKDQDIVNAMALIKIAKEWLQAMREDGWEALLDEVSLSCVKYNIDIHNMDDTFVIRGRQWHNAQLMTNRYYYQVDLFYTMIDMQLQELNCRFDKVNIELLFCLACLNPNDSFAAFDKQKLIRFA